MVFTEILYFIPNSMYRFTRNSLAIALVGIVYWAVLTINTGLMEKR